MTLKEKLKKFKNFQEQNAEPDWERYKEEWKKAIGDLHNTIMHKWLKEYEKEGLMEFSFLPTKRIDPYIGEYTTMSLEITLTGNKYLVLEPSTGITAEYDGKLEFYMRGNVNDKVNIVRKINNDKSHEWLIASSPDPKDHVRLDKQQLEKLIDKWLQ